MEAPRNPFSFYVRQTWNHHAGANFDAKMASASTAWAGMDNNARAPYVLEAYEASQAAAAAAAAAPIAQAATMAKRKRSSRKAPLPEDEGEDEDEDKEGWSEEDEGKGKGNAAKPASKKGRGRRSPMSWTWEMFLTVLEQFVTFGEDGTPAVVPVSEWPTMQGRFTYPLSA